MQKLYFLLKAMFSQDMNFLKYKAKQKSSKITKILLPAVIGGLVMLSVGGYAYMFAEPLSKMGLTFVMLTVFMILISVVTFVEGMYKSQGILFDSKDNDLLFSLPIKKSNIFALRIIKLLVFQFIYNLFFIIPTFIVYILLEKPSASFYVVSFIMLFLIPIIPTVLSSILGYIVKGISTRFKAKKIVQTVLSTALFLSIFFLSYNVQGLIKGLTENATSINEILTKIYYPVGTYINLIQKFDLIELIKLILINIIPLIIIIYIGAIYYFKIISKSSESGTKHKANKNKEQVKVSSSLKSLVKKEIGRYFSSPIYMFNTSFGIVIILVITIALCVNPNGLIQMLTANEETGISIETIYEYLPKIYLQLIIFVGCMTPITASSISLEGKSFNITKSLPVKIQKIFMSKILASNVITLPLMIISDIIFAVKFNIPVYDVLFILAFTIIIPTFTAILGLLINLKYPKMKWTSDTEVVKQSLSSTVSVFAGFIIFGITTFLMTQLHNNINTFILLEMLAFIVIILILSRILKTYGENKFREINI